MTKAIVAGAILGTLIGVLFPPISRFRSRRLARKHGAVWVGFAQFDALDPGTNLIIAAALQNLTPPFGWSFMKHHPQGKNMPVSGRLIVYESSIRWEPGLWIGPDEPKAWSLPRSSVRNVEVKRMPLPAIGISEVRLTTSEGEASFKVADGKGLKNAFGSSRGTHSWETA